jgi:hypothetical protein
VDGVLELASRFFLPEQVVTASDGTLWRSAWAALLHDLVELKWKRLFPTLQDPAV